MQLASFIKELLNDGQVTLGTQLLLAGDTPDQEAIELLKNLYLEEVLHVPFKAPAFDPEAAVWGAKYLFVTTQITVFRDITEEAVKARLLPYSGSIDAASIFSADLMLRYLPDLLQLAKGLAPDDVLVQCLQQTLLAWPFSSVGTGIAGEIDIRPILSHTSLKYAYRNKIIRHQDKSRIHHPLVQELIREALGEYASTLWPDFQIIN